MAVCDLNHINITAPGPLLERLRQFYVAVLGLDEGWRPEFPVAGHWLYAGGKPIVHLMAGESPDGPARGHLDHVAFTCDGLEAMEERLHRAQVPYKRRDLSAFGMVQLNLEDPAGTVLELNFSVTG